MSLAWPAGLRSYCRKEEGERRGVHRDWALRFTLTAGTSISGTVSLDPDPGDGGATVQQMWIEAFDPANHEHVRERRERRL